MLTRSLDPDVESNGEQGYLYSRTATRWVDLADGEGLETFGSFRLVAHKVSRMGKKIWETPRLGKMITRPPFIQPLEA